MGDAAHVYYFPATAGIAAGYDSTLDNDTLIYDTPITAQRQLSLDTTDAYEGAKLRIVRTANCTGAYNIGVGTGPLKALTAAGQWCEVTYDGSAGVLTAYGSL